MGRQLLQAFFETMNYYRAMPEDFETAVVGDLGMAWGVFVEEFQEKGKPPERARVRFSTVLAKGAQGWQVLLYQRDIQPFDEKGRYPRTLTAISGAD